MTKFEEQLEQALSLPVENISTQEEFVAAELRFKIKDGEEEKVNLTEEQARTVAFELKDGKRIPLTTDKVVSIFNSIKRTVKPEDIPKIKLDFSVITKRVPNKPPTDKPPVVPPSLVPPKNPPVVPIEPPTDKPPVEYTRSRFKISASTTFAGSQKHSSSTTPSREENYQVTEIVTSTINVPTEITTQVTHPGYTEYSETLNACNEPVITETWVPEWVEDVTSVIDVPTEVQEEVINDVTVVHPGTRTDTDTTARFNEAHLDITTSVNKHVDVGFGYTEGKGTIDTSSRTYLDDGTLTGTSYRTNMRKYDGLQGVLGLHTQKGGLSSRIALNKNSHDVSLTAQRAVTSKLDLGVVLRDLKVDNHLSYQSVGPGGTYHINKNTDLVFQLEAGKLKLEESQFGPEEEASTKGGSIGLIHRF